jgi:hypothetical protein
MTPDERRALREKHTAHGRYGKGTTSCDVCPGYYPCDVIKALDWADEVLEELKDLTAHFEGVWY